MTINVEIKINPEYTNLVPQLGYSAKEELRNSIKEKEMYLPGIVNEKCEILDGHNRFYICREENIDFKFVIMKFANKLEEKEFVIDINNEKTLKRF